MEHQMEEQKMSEYSVFEQLLLSIRGWQGGTVVLRTIMHPLFDEATAQVEGLKFYEEFDTAADRDRDAVEMGVFYANLQLPPRPEPIPEPEPTPPVLVIPGAEEPTEPATPPVLVIE